LNYTREGLRPGPTSSSVRVQYAAAVLLFVESGARGPRLVGMASGASGREGMTAVNDFLTAPGRGFGTRVTTAKAAIAATLAYSIAAWLGPQSLAVFAPLVALFTVQSSAYATLAQGVQRVIGTVLGVLLATIWLELAGTTWWSIAIIVVIGVSAGRLLPLSFAAQAQIPIAMLLVLLFGAAIPDYPYWRVIDAAIGGLIGILIGLVIPERPQVAPAQAALVTWSDALVGLIAAMGREVALQAPNLPPGARHAFVLRSRALYDIAASGRATVAHARESVAFNPLGRRAREAVASLTLTERWLVRLTLEVRVLSVTIDDMYDRAHRSPRLPRETLSRLLIGLGALLEQRGRGLDVSAGSLALARELSEAVDVVATLPSSDAIPLASVSLLGRIDQLRQEVADPELGPAMDAPAP